MMKTPDAVESAAVTTQASFATSAATPAKKLPVNLTGATPLTGTSKVTTGRPSLLGGS